jgi:hypothetical protein
MPMQITWLDLLAANMAAFLWCFCVLASVYWIRLTRERKALPWLAAIALIAPAAGVAIWRAHFWYVHRAAASAIVPDKSSPAIDSLVWWDLFAASVFGFGWLCMFLGGVHWIRTERAKTVPAFILLTSSAFLLLCVGLTVDRWVTDRPLMNLPTATGTVLQG